MLKDLYKDLEPESNEICRGCSILDSNKSVKCHMDYEGGRQSDILFLSDSFKLDYGTPVAFKADEHKILSNMCKLPFATSVSVKCSDVKDGDISPTDANLCRGHLDATISKIKPKIVFACGNLPLKMLLKKSGIKDKRGNIYEYTTKDGHSCTVMPIYPPYMAIVEPKYLTVIMQDIANGIEKVLKGKVDDYDFSYKVIRDGRELMEFREELSNISEPIAFDLETGGLDFLHAKVTTISISSSKGTWAIPFDHKDSPWSNNLDPVIVALRDVLGNTKNRKIGHNVKFDIKFLKNYGIAVVNAYDTKVMHRIINENLPNSLSELVKLYFPLFSVDYARNK